MVTKWGLSEKLGPITYGEDEGEVFLGRTMGRRKEISDTTAHVIDEEVRIIIDRNFALAEKILQKNRDKLEIMAQALIKYETITELQLKDIMEGKEPREPKDWSLDKPSKPVDPAKEAEKKGLFPAEEKSDIPHADGAT
jgi:cell division protease FtsH